MQNSSISKPVEKVGVLLVNLGTPDGYDTKNVRTYLKEFLSDRRVIDWPRVIWYPILHGIVLRTRPEKTGAAYAKIWNREKNESPLRTYSRSQSEQLAQRLADYPDVVVDWGMRYGNPSIVSRLDHLRQQGCERIVVFPLYPQYSATTTATVNDKTSEALAEMDWKPAIRTVSAYPQEPAYIDALATSIENHLKQLDFKPEKIIASFHGIPVRYADNGDPYPQQCEETTRLLRERLGFSEDYLMLCFQSRFGPENWLQPYTDKTIEKLASEGIKNLAVFNPGFVCDCLETLEEIGVEGKEIFHAAGGDNFSHIPCLNDSAESMDVFEKIVRKELDGWV